MVESRWPNVIGMIGIILGALIALDQFDDLLIHLWWNEADWAGYVGPDIADLIMRAAGSIYGRIFASIAQLCLGILLVVASVRLRARRRSGGFLSQTWAWLAIAYAIIEIGTAALVLSAWSEEVVQIAGAGWEAWVAYGLWAALATMIAWPLFLLIWFARQTVKSEIAGWPD